MKPLVAFTVLLLCAGTELAFAQAPDGQDLYLKQCRACHGVAGVPPAALAKSMKNLRSLADPAFMATLPLDSMVRALANGKGQMKPFAGKLTNDQLVAIAKYTRSLSEKSEKKP